MPRSGRPFVFAFVGCLIASGVLAYSLYPVQPRITGNAGYQKLDAQYRAGGSDCEPGEIKLLPDIRRARRAIICSEKEEQHRLQSNELIQQRRAADAAEAMTSLAYQQTAISALGLALGFITMGSAIAAAFYARSAAIATENTVQATWQLGKPSQEANIVIGKPLANFIPPRPEIPGHEVKSQTIIPWDNAGPTSAYNIRVKCCLTINDKGNEIFSGEGVLVHRVGSEIERGNNKGVVFNFAIPETLVNAMVEMMGIRLGKEPMPFAKGEFQVTYETVFEDTITKIYGFYGHLSCNNMGGHTPVFVSVSNEFSGDGVIIKRTLKSQLSTTDNDCRHIGK